MQIYSHEGTILLPGISMLDLSLDTFSQSAGLLVLPFPPVDTGRSTAPKEKHTDKKKKKK